MYRAIGTADFLLLGGPLPDTRSQGDCVGRDEVYIEGPRFDDVRRFLAPRIAYQGLAEA